MGKLRAKETEPVVGLVIDPRAMNIPDADAPGVVSLLDSEPTPEQRYSHALRLLHGGAAVEPEEGGDS
jgi:hypothetical protein